MCAGVVVRTESYVFRERWRARERDRERVTARCRRVRFFSSFEAFFSSLFFLRPEIRRDYPLNLSILISGGKETNQDSLSNGE